MSQLIGACGLICSECPAFVATQANDAAAIAVVAADWSQRYGGQIAPESVWCEGCMTQGGRKCGHVGECDIRPCVVERALTNCAQCPDFACERITGFMAMVPQAKATLEGRTNRSRV